MTISLINRPCRLVIRSFGGDFDEYGGDIPTETTVDTVCEVQQFSRTEQAQAEISDTLWHGYFLPDVENLETADSISVDGQTFELVGDPWRARNPRTRRFSHVEATLRRTGGDEGGS